MLPRNTRSIAAISAIALLSTGGAKLVGPAFAASPEPVEANIGASSSRLAVKINPADIGKTSGIVSKVAAPKPVTAIDRGLAPKALDPKSLPPKSLAPKALAPELVHPVVGKVDYGDVIAAFGNARGRPHEGQDIFAPAGTPVVAPRKSVMVEAGTDGGRGNWVTLYSAAEKESYSYFHMIEPTGLAVGAKLKAGEIVGKVGCTGSCSGDHLHFEVRQGRGPYGEARDPMPMLSRSATLKASDLKG